MEADLQAVRDIVEAAGLPEDVLQSVTWCLGQLSPLYRELIRTCDSRHGDEIQRLVRATLQALADQAADSHAAEAVASRLQAMHERLGIPRLNFSLPSSARKSRPRKAG